MRVLLEAAVLGRRRHPGARPFALWGIPDGVRWRVRNAPGIDVAAQTKRLCLLALRAGREEVCPGEECPLWENGGCALERLSANGELDVDEWPEDDRAEL